jgi:hypothetical protein
MQRQLRLQRRLQEAERIQKLKEESDALAQQRRVRLSEEIEKKID